MDERLAWMLTAALSAVGLITLIGLRRRAGSAKAGPVEALPRPRPTAVARTHFAEGGGYVETGGVVRWASADPAARILPGHVLHYVPTGDGHTVTVVRAEDSAQEEHPA